MASPKWDVWQCTHACTAFFTIPCEEVEQLVPGPLVVKRDKHGRAQIEIGYVRFREGTHELPVVEELAWAIAVERRRGFGFAFYAMNIAADTLRFLDWNENLGFAVQRPPVAFRTNLERRSYEVSDADGPICTLRHEPEGSVPLPFFPVTTEVWTRSREGGLERRIFKWRGAAGVHFAPAVASDLYDHAFFKGVRVSRAQPLPTIVFASRGTVAAAAQLFSAPRLAESTAGPR